jgi:hypothetical protein
VSQRFDDITERIRNAIQENDPKTVGQLLLDNPRVALAPLFELAGYQIKADELFSAMLKNIKKDKQLQYLEDLFKKAVAAGKPGTLELLKTEFNYSTNDIQILADVIAGNNPEIRDKVMAMHSNVCGTLLLHSGKIQYQDPHGNDPSELYLRAASSHNIWCETYVATGIVPKTIDSNGTQYEVNIKKYVSALSAAVKKGDLLLVKTLVETHHASLTDKNIPLLSFVNPELPNAYDMYLYILQNAEKHVLMPRAFDACFRCGLSKAKPALMNLILEKYSKNITSAQFDLYVAEYKNDSNMLEKLYRSRPDLIDQQRVSVAILSADLQLLKAAQKVNVENLILAAHQNDKSMWHELLLHKSLVADELMDRQKFELVIVKLINFANEKSEEAKVAPKILAAYSKHIRKVYARYPINLHAWDYLPDNKEMFRVLLEHEVDSLISDQRDPKILAAEEKLKACIMGNGNPALSDENAKLLSKTASTKFIFSQFKVYEALYMKDLAVGLITALVPPPQSTSSSVSSYHFKSKKSDDPATLAPLAREIGRLATMQQASVDNILKAVLDFYVMTYLQEKTSGSSGPILKKLEDIMKEFKLVELIEKSEHRNASKKHTDFTVHKDKLDSKIFRYIALNYWLNDGKKLFEQIIFSAIGYTGGDNAASQTNPQVFANAVKIAERMTKQVKKVWNASVDTYLPDNPLGVLLKLNPDSKEHTGEKSIIAQFGKIPADNFLKAYQAINEQKRGQQAVEAASAASASAAAATIKR